MTVVTSRVVFMCRHNHQSPFRCLDVLVGVVLDHISAVIYRCKREKKREQNYSSYKGEREKLINSSSNVSITVHSRLYDDTTPLVDLSVSPAPFQSIPDVCSDHMLQQFCSWRRSYRKCRSSRWQHPVKRGFERGGKRVIKMSTLSSNRTLPVTVQACMVDTLISHDPSRSMDLVHI